MLPVEQADFVHGDDVGMLQPAGRLNFGAGSAAGRLALARSAGQDHLEGDDAVELDLPGLVDDAHAAAAEFVEQFVFAEAPARRDVIATGRVAWSALQLASCTQMSRLRIQRRVGVPRRIVERLGAVWVGEDGIASRSDRGSSRLQA